MTTVAIQIYSLSYLISGFNIFGSAFFTALNNGPVSALISFVRTLLFPDRDDTGAAGAFRVERRVVCGRGGGGADACGHGGMFSGKQKKISVFLTIVF